jgi:hypothetical protein
MGNMTATPPEAQTPPGPDGSPEEHQDIQVVTIPAGEGADDAELVAQPAKVMRIGTMIKQLLEEVKAAPLDEAGRDRLSDIYRASLQELEDGLAPELVAELERLSFPIEKGTTPSDAELRIAQAQLVGWLEGLFHGIQATLFAQQMAARAQFEQMRRALPPGAVPRGGPQPKPGEEEAEPPSGRPGGGMYL